MAASILRFGHRGLMYALCALATAALVPGLAGAAEPAGAVGQSVVAVGQPVVVTLDQAKVLKLPERTATLVIGNPLIADVSLQTGGILIVTGKGYGVTNLLALDRAGGVLMEHPIEVQGPRDNVVVLYRGIERESYSCSPNCERRITIGDTQNYFAATLGQTNALSAQAQGAQPR